MGFTDQEMLRPVAVLDYLKSKRRWVRGIEIRRHFSREIGWHLKRLIVKGLIESKVDSRKKSQRLYRIKHD